MVVVVSRINALGVRKERTSKAVISKIDQLTQSYKKASDWANGTGAGVLTNQGREPFESFVSLLLFVPPHFTQRRRH